MRLRFVGAGRAAKSLGGALQATGAMLQGYLGRNDDLRNAAQDTDVLIVATPDDVISEVANSVEPNATALVVHLSGVLGLDALKGHPRCAALHPLVSLPSPEIGAQRLLGAWFAIAGDPQVNVLVEALGGRAFVVAESARPTYHAAAVIASNHLVALLGQAERVAQQADVPFAVLLDLASESLKNVAELGPKAALTGPAARGDVATITRHLQALPSTEHATYTALAQEAKRLAN